jgi:small subunit ribosomal protein S1
MTYQPEGALLATSENHEYLSSVTGLERAQEKQKILEGTAVLCDRDFCLHFDLYGTHAIMPRAEVQDNRAGEQTKDIAVLTRVGKPSCFTIIGFRETGGERVAILSRRAAQAECRRQFLSTLVPGDILPARITHIEPFGAFVDIGCGIVSLLPIDAISVSRISHPTDRHAVGEHISVVVKSIDASGRIYVTERELLGSWEENVARFAVGQTVAGIVRSIESYGIFVELAPNLAGLAEWRAGVEVGASAAVYIKSILPAKMKVKLVIIDTQGAGVKIPTNYYISHKTAEHIAYWRYSPCECKKVIETVFSD